MGPHEHRLRKSIVAHRPERENEVQRRGGGNELGQDMGMASMLTGDMMDHSIRRETMGRSERHNRKVTVHGRVSCKGVNGKKLNR